MAKRSDFKNLNGEGSVYQVSENKWRASIRLGRDANGKPIRKEFTGKTERAVRSKLAQFKRDEGAMKTVSLGKITVGEYAKKFLEMKKRVLKPLSYERLNSVMNVYVIKQFSDKAFCKLTTEEIQEFLDEVSKDKSFSTIRKIKDAISAMYSYDLGLPPSKRSCEYNPCANLIISKKSTKTSEKNINYFTDEELSLITSEILRNQESTGKPVYPYGKIYLLLLNTGMRLGEALALNREDIDLNKKILIINKNVVQVKNKNGKGYRVIVQDDPKTFAGNRTLSLNNAVISIIKDLYEAFPDCDGLAQNSNGIRVTPQNAEKTFKQILKSCKIEGNGRRCHALRHTFATKMFEQGIDVKIVSNILGHQSSSFTRDTYISVIQRKQAEAMAALPELNY